MRTMTIVKPAFIYFAIVFAIGFALGAIRVLMITPAMGEVLATVFELPAMLAASWFVCAWIIRRYRIPPSAGTRMGMGLLALLLLLTAETALGVFGFGRNIEAQVAEYLKIGPLLGLAAQMAFAAFPLLQRKTV